VSDNGGGNIPHELDVWWDSALGTLGLGSRHVKGQQYRELASLPHEAADFDAAMMLFHDRRARDRPRPVPLPLVV